MLLHIILHKQYLDKTIMRIYSNQRIKAEGWLGLSIPAHLWRPWSYLNKSALVLSYIENINSDISACLLNQLLVQESSTILASNTKLSGVGYNIYISYCFISCFKAFGSFQSTKKISENRAGPSTFPQTPARHNFSQKPKFNLFFEALPNKNLPVKTTYSPSP